MNANRYVVAGAGFGGAGGLLQGALFPAERWRPVDASPRAGLLQVLLLQPRCS